MCIGCRPLFLHHHQRELYLLKQNQNTQPRTYYGHELTKKESGFLQKKSKKSRLGVSSTYTTELQTDRQTDRQTLQNHWSVLGNGLTESGRERRAHFSRLNKYRCFLAWSKRRAINAWLYVYTTYWWMLLEPLLVSVRDVKSGRDVGRSERWVDYTCACIGGRQVLKGLFLVYSTVNLCTLSLSLPLSLSLSLTHTHTHILVMVLYI